MLTSISKTDFSTLKLVFSYFSNANKLRLGHMSKDLIERGEEHQERIGKLVSSE